MLVQALKILSAKELKGGIWGLDRVELCTWHREVLAWSGVERYTI